jgi:hypothetical protein
MDKLQWQNVIPHDDPAPVGDLEGRGPGGGQGKAVARKSLGLPHLSGGRYGRAHAAGNRCARHYAPATWSRCPEGGGGGEQGVVVRVRGWRWRRARGLWRARQGDGDDGSSGVGERAHEQRERRIRRAHAVQWEGR